MQLCRTKFRKSCILLAENWIKCSPWKTSSQIEGKIWRDHLQTEAAVARAVLRSLHGCTHSGSLIMPHFMYEFIRKYEFQVSDTVTPWPPRFHWTYLDCGVSSCTVIVYRTQARTSNHAPNSRSPIRLQPHCQRAGHLTAREGSRAEAGHSSLHFPKSVISILSIVGVHIYAEYAIT